MGSQRDINGRSSNLLKKSTPIQQLKNSVSLERLEAYKDLTPNPAKALAFNT